MTGPDQGVITDLDGVAWQINESGSVMAGAAVDHDKQPVMALTCVDGMVWRQTKDQRWSCKRHPKDPWGPPTEVSPVPGQVNESAAIIDSDKARSREIMNAIVHFREDFDNWTAVQANVDELSAGAALSNKNVLVETLASIAAAQTANHAAVIALLTQIRDAVTTAPNPMSAIAKLQTDFTNLTETLNSMALGPDAATQAEIAETLADVKQILAIVKSEESEATRLKLDVEQATHTEQPVPPPKPK